MKMKPTSINRIAGITNGGKYRIVDEVSAVVSVRNELHQSLVNGSADAHLNARLLPSLLSHCLEPGRTFVCKNVGGLILATLGSAHGLLDIGEHLIEGIFNHTLDKFALCIAGLNATGKALKDALAHAKLKVVLFGAHFRHVAQAFLEFVGSPVLFLIHGLNCITDNLITATCNGNEITETMQIVRVNYYFRKKARIHYRD